MKKSRLTVLLMAALLILLLVGLMPVGAQDSEEVGNDALIGIEPNEPNPIENGAIQRITAEAVNLRPVPNDGQGSPITRSLLKDTVVKPLADTGNGWNLVIAINPDGTYAFNTLGYINLAAADLAPVEGTIEPKAALACDIDTYTAVQGWVRFGSRYVSYIPAEPCSVLLDGRVKVGEKVDDLNVHDLIAVVEISSSGRIESSQLVNGLLVWAEGTYARYPVGNTMDAPELNSTLAWTLIEGWARDIRERLDDPAQRADGPAWVIRQTNLDGTNVLYKFQEYPETATAGSKTYTTCDGLTAPEDLPVNGLWIGATPKDVAHFVAAVGSQECKTLFIGYRNIGLDMSATVVLIDGMRERFNYVLGRFVLFPAGTEPTDVATYAMENMPVDFPAGTAVVVDGVPGLPAIITLQAAGS